MLFFLSKNACFYTLVHHWSATLLYWHDGSSPQASFSRRFWESSRPDLLQTLGHTARYIPQLGTSTSELQPLPQPPSKRSTHFESAQFLLLSSTWSSFLDNLTAFFVVIFKDDHNGKPDTWCSGEPDQLDIGSKFNCGSARWFLHLLFSFKYKLLTFSPLWNLRAPRSSCKIVF